MRPLRPSGNAGYQKGAALSSGGGAGLNPVDNLSTGVQFQPAGDEDEMGLRKKVEWVLIGLAFGVAIALTVATGVVSAALYAASFEDTQAAHECECCG